MKNRTLSELQAAYRRAVILRFLAEDFDHAIDTELLRAALRAVSYGVPRAQVNEDAGWLERHGMPASTTVAEAAQSRQLQDELQALVDQANKAVSQAEAIKVFRVVSTDFTESSGHLTPSLKIKRAQVLKDFSDVVEDIYSGQKV